MKILLSPAKMMSLDSKVDWKVTTPQFLNYSYEIMRILKGMSLSDLTRLMKISKDIAELNIERNQCWSTNPDESQAISAILAFKGEVYRSLSPETLEEKHLEYLNNNILILSGLYGILIPSDKIMLYRLEMGSKLDVNGSRDLYGFWKEVLTSFLNKKLRKDEFILNLSSNEYLKVLDKKKLKNPIIDVEFQEYKNGEFKKIMMYFKRARGSMARYCIANEIQTIDDIKSYNIDNYSYNEYLSNKNKIVFTR